MPLCLPREKGKKAARGRESLLSHSHPPNLWPPQPRAHLWAAGPRDSHATSELPRVAPTPVGCPSQQPEISLGVGLAQTSKQLKSLHRRCSQALET